MQELSKQVVKTALYITRGKRVAGPQAYCEVGGRIETTFYLSIHYREHDIDTDGTRVRTLVFELPESDRAEVVRELDSCWDAAQPAKSTIDRVRKAAAARRAASSK